MEGAKEATDDPTLVRPVDISNQKMGEYDKYGFLWIDHERGCFYDPDGYYFLNGRDQYGGRYEGIQYIPSEEYKTVFDQKFPQNVQDEET